MIFYISRWFNVLFLLHWINLLSAVIHFVILVPSGRRREVCISRDITSESVLIFGCKLSHDAKKDVKTMIIYISSWFNVLFLLHWINLLSAVIHFVIPLSHSEMSLYTAHCNNFTETPNQSSQGFLPSYETVSFGEECDSKCVKNKALSGLTWISNVKYTNVSTFIHHIRIVDLDYD